MLHIGNPSFTQINHASVKGGPASHLFENRLQLLEGGTQIADGCR